MRILHVIDSLGSGGKERQLCECLKGLSAHKKIVVELVIMSHNIHYTAVNDLNVKVHYLIRKIRKDPRMLGKLYRICTDFKPHIIHAWDSMASVYVVPIAKILSIKLINGMIRDAIPKSAFSDKRWLRSKLTFPFSDIIVANSYAGLKCYNAPRRKSLCIHNAFDFGRLTHLHDERTVKAKFNINTDMVVGMVASFSVKKDYETYISAAQMLLEKNSNVTFLAIGDGVNLSKCKKLVTPQFQSKIKFLGSQQHVESIVNIFDLGVLSTNTRVHEEGISNSIMEYMALGKPVVATRGGGTEELVLDGKTGFLVNCRDVKGVYLKIKRLLEDEDLSIRMGGAGKERIRSTFSLKKMTDSFVDLYECVINNTECTLK